MKWQGGADTLPVISISRAFSSSSGISPLDCNFSISYHGALDLLQVVGGESKERTSIVCCTPRLSLMSVLKYVGDDRPTYALPITPQASFAIAPFSLSRAKKPGLAEVSDGVTQKMPEGLHPKEFTRLHERSRLRSVRSSDSM